MHKDDEEVPGLMAGRIIVALWIFSTGAAIGWILHRWIG